METKTVIEKIWDAYGRVKDDSGVPLSGGGHLFHKLKKCKIVKINTNMIFFNIVTERPGGVPMTFTDSDNA